MGHPRLIADQAGGHDGEAVKRLAHHGTEAERLALAGHSGVSPEILYFLAGDKMPAVRAAVAANTATPAQADILLAADGDPMVRAAVGRKLAPRAGALAAAQTRLGMLAWRTLCDLAVDAAVRVRAVVAEEIKALPDAPHALILQLANDAAMEVAGPVIRLSPLLTEADLLALVAAPPAAATLTAVARRPALSAPLSDAVAETRDPAAITALLRNGSATIREATLDALIVQAASRSGWQEALVHRPALSPRALQALALCVAEHLLEVLSARPDLDPAVAGMLRARVEDRLMQEGPGTMAEQPPAALFEAAALRSDGAAMRLVLADQAGVALGAIDQALRLHSAKGLVSLCWQAGFGLRAAMLAQSVLGRIAPASVLLPTATGDWPLSVDEMRWQIELLSEPGD